MSSTFLGDVILSISESAPPPNDQEHTPAPVGIVYRVVDQTTNYTRYFQTVNKNIVLGCLISWLMQVWVEACSLVISNKCIALCPPNSIYKGLRTLQNKRQTCFFNPRGASCLCLLSLFGTYGHTRTPRFLRTSLSLWKSLPVALSQSLSWWSTSLECLGSHSLSL